VAVVDAPGDPNIAADLATYRAEYGLPACTTDSGCLNIVGQDGGPPSGSLFNNAGWGVETALDLDMVSAACPACHILLVEANDSSLDSLGAAEQTAIRLGADVVSNSYGIYELAGITSYAPDYQSSTVPIVASSGDNGYGLNGTLGGTQFPASLPTVTAVGGTALTKAPHTKRGWTETAWSGSGSGCSAYFTKPRWQRDAHCGMRTVADTAAVADPSTPVAVYDSYLPGGTPGWLLVGGTSAAAPLIAAVYALAGNTTQAASPAYLYGHTHSLYDVTSGSNGSCGQSNYLCNARHGYDGPTGWGTPDGTGAF
jgi:subtilase family serine protease